MLTAHSFEQKGSLQRVKEQQTEEGAVLGAVLSGGGQGGYNVAQVCCRQVKALGWRSTASMVMPAPVCHPLLRGDLAVPARPPRCLRRWAHTSCACTDLLL